MSIRSNEIIVPVCDALAYAHSIGVVHCDIKPGNIFLHNSRTGEVVKVLDFGIARLAGADGSVKPELVDPPETISGTPAYMAPERLLCQPYDGRVDVYSVGMMLTRMLCGAIPPPNQQPSLKAGERKSACISEEMLAINPKIPRRIAELIVRALAYSAEARPTMQEFLADWMAIMGEHLSSSSPAKEAHMSDDSDGDSDPAGHPEEPAFEGDAPTMSLLRNWING